MTKEKLMPAVVVSFVVAVVAVVLLVAVAFDIRVRGETFEDGSGRVAIVYCMPGGLCQD